MIRALIRISNCRGSGVLGAFRITSPARSVVAAPVDFGGLGLLLGRLAPFDHSAPGVSESPVVYGVDPRASLLYRPCR